MINTHFHADFVSGHLELVDATGAWIGFGEAAQTDYPIRRLADGEHISLGEVDLEILSTPGHTWESISVLVREHPGAEPTAVLTGDSLFIGDVGRPDLVNIGDSSTSDLARAMYHTIHDKLLKLPDDVTVMPAHGAGSSCGKNLSTELTSTIGEQRRTNPSVQPMSEDDFVELITHGQPAAPAVLLRRRGDEQAGPPAAGPVAHDSRADPGADPAGARRRCARGGCPQRRRFRGRASARLGQRRIRRPLRRNRRHGRRDRRQDRADHLSRRGAGRRAAAGPRRLRQRHRIPHRRPRRRLPRRVVRPRADRSRVSPAELDGLLAEDAVILIDIRNPGEVELGRIPGSINIPLAQLRARLDMLPTDKPIVVHCAGGWRSSVAASLLRAQGFDNVSDLAGGYNAWVDAHAIA